MLVLTRNIGQVIKIAPDITVTTLGINGAQIRIGIDAPKAIEVHREETYQRKKESDRVSVFTGRAHPADREMPARLAHDPAARSILTPPPRYLSTRAAIHGRRLAAQRFHRRDRSLVDSWRRRSRYRGMRYANRVA